MCAENKKQHVIGIIDDFDAVSLYPSAMHRLDGYLRGSPKVLENKTYGFLRQQDGYFVQIKVLKVNKKYKFPLMSYINGDGVRIFTNEPPQNLYVCKIDLEDLIKFHQIEFEIIDGYYYNEGRNHELRGVIDFVFNERLKLKKLKNPLQEIYKLIMNSSYGKTLQKAIPDQIEFKSSKDLDNYIDKHYNRIINYEELYGGSDEYKKHKVKVEKGINDHYNNAHCGVEVLAMSKRIMNEVMTLAEDNGLDIYYQDTDSMHIKHKDIGLLAKKYDELYGRELIGKNMGQFHADFESDILVGEIHAVESLFLGKKCYIDKLVGEEEGVYDYHIRMKGVPNGSIKYKAKLEGRTVMDIYKSLYAGNEEAFDLCCDGDKISFDYNADYTISTRLKFERRLKFDREIVETPMLSSTQTKDGKLDHPNYFIYKWHSNDCNLIYVGSTNDIQKRKRSHAKACNDANNKFHNVKVYQTMRDNGGIENWTMEMIDQFHAESKRDVQEREQEWINKLKPSLNMINAIRQERVKEWDITHP
eukprot:888981-Prymnesium_polylepis.1